MKTIVKTGLNLDSATVYEKFFVPALLAEWAPKVADAAAISSGDVVLDVACGTGIVARYLKAKKRAEVVAVDINEAMLYVAEDNAKDIRWIKSPAEALPFEDNMFDAVTCQFGLMFFEDRTKSLQEVKRVLKTGGKAAVAVWDKIESSPGYNALYNLINKQMGETIAVSLRDPFVLGEKDILRDIFDKAGFKSFQIKTEKGHAVFPSIKSWIRTEVRGWIFSDLVNDEELNDFIRKAEEELSHLTDKTGKVKFDMSAHIVSAVKTSG